MRIHFSIPASFMHKENFQGRHTLGDGGGKGGQMLGKTECQNYIVKELNNDDHSGLINNTSK